MVGATYDGLHVCPLVLAIAMLLASNVRMVRHSRKMVKDVFISMFICLYITNKIIHGNTGTEISYLHAPIF